MTRPPADQAVRDRVVRDFDTTFLLEAGAGTGKTTVLVVTVRGLEPLRPETDWLVNGAGAFEVGGPEGDNPVGASG